jgi:hypothetical protein
MPNMSFTHADFDNSEVASATNPLNYRHHYS